MFVTLCVLIRRDITKLGIQIRRTIKYMIFRNQVKGVVNRPVILEKKKEKKLETVV